MNESDKKMYALVSVMNINNIQCLFHCVNKCQLFNKVNTTFFFIKMFKSCYIEKRVVIIK